MGKASREFQVFVKPAGAVCNLDCQYCYYRDKRSLYPDTGVFRMPESLLEEYIVQHIAAGFTAGLVAWLASVSRLPVHLALAGELPRPGHVYLAPDDQHLRVGLNGELETTRDGRHNGLRPSVGVLFRSVAEHFGPRAIGVLLTGMGRDGAEELKFMADRGALTIAQDEGSCVVFGMPAEAIKLGAARFVLSPRQIRELLNTTVTNRVSKGEINA